MTKEQVTDLVLGCIDNFNEINGTQLGNNMNTVLVGSGSELDSMDFVALIIDIEDEFAREYSNIISITAEKAMSRKNSPFRTIGTLIDYVFELVQ